MLSGRQHDVWIDALQQFVDLSSVAFIDDEAWRKYPVFNWMAHHFRVQIAKLTENIPVLGALPATSDNRDATLAEVFDPVFRYEWDQMGMPELLFPLYGWVLVAGRGVLKLRWDPDRGPVKPLMGPMPDSLAVLCNLLPEQRELLQVPYHKQEDGSYQAIPDMDESGQVVLGPDGLPTFAEAELAATGDLACDCPAPTTLLMPYGPEPPHRKPWYIEEYLMHVDDVRAQFGKTVEPDATVQQDRDTLLQFSYSDPLNGTRAAPTQSREIAVDGMTRIRCYWEFKDRGRLAICTRDTVLDDDRNPYVIPGQQDRPVNPFFVFDRVSFPFRQEGDTDYESLNPIQRALNRRKGGLMDAADLNEQPGMILNSNMLGDVPADATNKPGWRLKATGNGTPFWKVDPPALPASNLQMTEILEGDIRTLGNMGNDSGTVPNDKRSGELLTQDRFNTDRPWGATLRMHSYVWARMGEAMMTILGVGADDDRILSLSGEDNAAKFLTVRKDLFAGRINVRPVPESAVMETRDAKQQRITAMVTSAASLPPPWGDVLLKALNQPDLGRLTRPGGEAYSLAIREIMEMVTSGQVSPVLPEHNDDVHLTVLVEWMQTMEFRNLDPQLQGVLRMHKQLHEANKAAKSIQQTQQAAIVAGHQTDLIQQAMPAGAGAAPPDGPGPTPGNAQSQTGTRPRLSLA